MNNVPPFSQQRGDIKYIKFEILQIVSPSEDVKFSNVRGLYLRKYGMSYEDEFPFNLFSFQIGVESWKTNSNLGDVSGMSVAV